jgi:hypothetical protein
MKSSLRLFILGLGGAVAAVEMREREGDADGDDDDDEVEEDEVVVGARMVRRIRLCNTCGLWRPINVEKNLHAAILIASLGELIRVIKVYRNKWTSCSSLCSAPTKSPNKNFRRASESGGEK